MAAGIAKIKSLADKMYTALSTEFPDSTCSLDYDCPQNLSIRGILSAQCTDKRVNITAKDLFAKYPDMESIANEDPEAIAAVIKPCGLTASKTKSVMAFAKKMTGEWGGKVPNDVDLLMEVPGIGRKSAQRLAFHVLSMSDEITESSDPTKVEKDIMKVFPEEQWISIGHLSVDLGRKYCTAQSPKCDECPCVSFCKRRI